MSIKKCEDSNCVNDLLPRVLAGGKPKRFCSRRCQSRTAMRRMAKSNPEQTKQWRAQFRKNNPRSVKNSELKKHYGITLDQYEQMLVDQKGLCAICKKPGKLVVDHCHATKKIRGLLHNNCNTALGLLQDSVEIATSAASYLAMGGF